MKSKIKVGSTVEYRSVSGKKKVKVLEIKKNGSLILETKKLGLCKNVSILPHRVKIVDSSTKKPKVKKKQSKMTIAESMGDLGNSTHFLGP